MRGTGPLGYQGRVRHHHGRVPYPPGYTAAFTEGRNLRDHARSRGPLAPHRTQVYGHRRSPPGWVLMLVLIPFAGITMSTLTVLFGTLALFGAVSWVAVPFLPLLVVGGVSFATARRARRRATLRRGGSAGTAPLPARPAAPPRPDVVWGRSRQRFDALRTAYAAYECDPMAVLRLPALADVTVPSTGRFVDAFAEAQALDTDACPGGTHGPLFVAAVDRAERAWQAAREAAERIRLSNLTPAERSTVERVIKLLTTARDSDSDAERVAAYARARTELAKLDRAGVVHVPLPAQAVLDAAGRGVLPAA